MRPVPQPPHASVALVPQLLAETDWYNWFLLFAKAVLHNTALTGTATFAGGTTAAVTFTTPEPTANYNVITEAPEDRRVWITSKTTTGFVINVSAASSATYTWTVIRQ